MELAALKRDTARKSASLRKEGLLPAVIYGPKEPATPITVDLKTFKKVFAEGGESTVITLSGLGEEKEALINEVAFHPVTGVPIHADFYVIEKGKPVKVSVPLVFDGVSPAVKDLGGILVKVMHELEIEVLPKELPHEIIVDISTLTEIDAQIKVGDIKLPASATPTDDANEIVAMVTEAKEEAEAPAMDISQIEVSVEKGKKEEEAPAE